MEGVPKRLPYPRGAILILSGYLLTRIVYYGITGGSVFYMQRFLGLSSSSSSTAKGIMDGVTLVFPVAGAILADSYWGKFRLVIIMSVVSISGSFICTFSSVPFLTGSDSMKQVTGILGLFLFGTFMGIQSSAYGSFGPDQFVLPEQEKQQQRFFNVLYWIVNAGAFVGATMTAQLRDSVQCFGNDCYALPFFILNITALIAVAIFYSGKNKYVHVPPNPLLQNCFRCIIYAGKKAVTDKEKPVEHWLDRAADKFDAGLIADVKRTFRVLLLFIPWPLFWALFFQTSTGMVFQAKRLDGYIGSYRIPPEMIPSLNPLLICILIPFIETFIYPFLDKRQILTKITTKMLVGMVLASIAFIMYGFLSLQLEQKILDESTTELNVHNANNCLAKLQVHGISHEFIIKPFSSLKISPAMIPTRAVVTEAKYSCNQNTHQTNVLFKEKHETTIILYPNGPKVLEPTLDYLKDLDAEAKVRMVSNRASDIESFTLRFNTFVKVFVLSNGYATFQTINPQSYSVELENKTLGTIDVRQDGVYDIVVIDDTAHRFIITRPSSLHVLWVTPQFVIITAGEVLFSVSCLTFAYTEAPVSMKAFLFSLHLLCLAIGIWLYAFFTKVSSAIKIFEHRASSEAFTYAIIMIFDVLLFKILVNYYYRKMKCSSVNSETIVPTVKPHGEEEKL